jgi:hypothetical protein
MVLHRLVELAALSLTTPAYFKNFFLEGSSFEQTGALAQQPRLSQRFSSSVSP